jgi:hypothetical protein
MNVDNTRELFLKEVVERSKTGNSILYEWKIIANRYYLWKRLYWISIIGSLVSFGFVITKRNSGRLNAYLYPFASAVSLFMISKYYYHNYINYLKQISNETDVDKIEKAMHFHKYSLLA